jgi:uncharacterized protein YabE (DUF348 family)
MSRLQRHFGLAFGLVFLAGALTALYWGARDDVQVRVDGRTFTVPDASGTVGQALAQAGIWLDPADHVAPPLETPVNPAVPIVVTRAGLVAVAANGQPRLLRALNATPTDLLQTLGLSLGPGDVLWADGAPMAQTSFMAASEPPASPRLVSLQRAVTIQILDGPAPAQTLRTGARTVGEALWDFGLTLYRGDVVDPPLETSLTPALVVTIQRSLPVTILADGISFHARTRAATVGEALAQSGVPLVGLDFTLPAEHQPIPAEGIITVVRVREEILTDQVLIPYETIYQALPEVEIDNVYQVQAGAPGVLRTLTRVRYENGVETARSTENQVQVSEPQPQVIGYGTNIIVRTLDTPDGPIEYWRAYTMYATSYAAKFTGRTPGTFSYGRTASGKYVTKGIVAIDRTMMPFGTRMYVPGYGFAEAADTGGGVRGRFIDLGYDDHNYVGWHSVVTVYFLTPIPPADTIRWIIPSTVP